MKADADLERGHRQGLVGTLYAGRSTIGEVSAIAFVAGFDVYAQPKDEPAKLLSELPELLQSMGLSLWRDAATTWKTATLPMN